MINKLLKEYIPSKYYVDYLIKENIDFSDFEVATILNNCINDVYKLHEVLKSLADNTKDERLIKQINKRIQSDLKQIKLIQNNDDNSIYVVYKGDGLNQDVYAYTTNYQTAYQLGLKSLDEFSIEKQRILKEVPEHKTISKGYTNPNFIDDVKVDVIEMDDYVDRLGYLHFNKENKLIYFYSKEYRENMDDEEVVEEIFDKDNFENQFLFLPYPFESGDIVKDTTNNQLGIITCSKEDYEHFKERVKNGLYADTFDSSTTVEYLNDNKSFTHNHPLPFLLEKYEIKESDEDYELLTAASYLIKDKGGLDYFLEVYKEKRKDNND